MANTIQELLDENLGKVQALLGSCQELERDCESNIDEYEDAVVERFYPALDQCAQEARSFKADFDALRAAFERTEQSAASAWEKTAESVENLVASVAERDQQQQIAVTGMRDQLAQIRTVVTERQEAIAQSFDGFDEANATFDTRVTDQLNRDTAWWEENFPRISDAFASWETTNSDCQASLIALNESCQHHRAQISSTAQDAIQTVQSNVEQTLAGIGERMNRSSELVQTSLLVNASGSVQEAVEGTLRMAEDFSDRFVGITDPIEERLNDLGRDARDVYQSLREMARDCVEVFQDL